MYDVSILFHVCKFFWDMDLNFIAHYGESDYFFSLLKISLLIIYTY